MLLANVDEQAETEQYADWSWYLNEFSEGQKQQGYHFFKVDDAILDALLEEASSYSEPYSALFMKQGQPGFFIKGLY